VATATVVAIPVGSTKAAQISLGNIGHPSLLEPVEPCRHTKYNNVSALCFSRDAQYFSG
jgi:hypothetical protein